MANDTALRPVDGVNGIGSFGVGSVGVGGEGRGRQALSIIFTLKMSS